MGDSGHVTDTQLKQNIDESSYICYDKLQAYQVVKPDPMQNSK